MKEYYSIERSPDKSNGVKIDFALPFNKFSQQKHTQENCLQKILVRCGMKT